jgi:hypothetical protein
MLRSTRRFMRAAGSILDLIPATDYSELLVHHSDSEALRSDIQAIGDDLRISMRPYARLRGRKLKRQLATAR